MSKSANVSVSMSPQCARAWRGLERSFGDDGHLHARMREAEDHATLEMTDDYRPGSR